MTHSVSVGIDVSKSKLDVCLINEDEITAFVVANTKDGINEIVAKLEESNISNKTQIVVESTGDYHLLCAYLLSSHFNVKVINPLLARKHMINSVRKVKSDKVDAKLLAEIGLKQDLSSHTFSKQELKKRKLVKLTNTIEKHISALKLSHKNMQAVFEEFGVESKSLDLLQKEIKDLKKVLDSLEVELHSLIEHKELATQLGLLSGITKASANKILALIEDRTFHSKSALVAFAGLDVSVKQSGKWRGKTRITKRGDSQLRKYLVQVAWGLLMHNKPFQEYANAYRQKGRKYFEILVIIARKFLKMLYGAISTKTDFNLKHLTLV